VGYLRIIAGEYRGRRIAVPPGVEVRPTADRVREALFSILGSAVRKARVLDAYAGSGALGFEALSRGAAQATFVEADRRALRTLRANAAALGVAERCTVHHGRVIDLLGRGAVAGPFDVVFADPPYEGTEAGAFLTLAASALAESGVVVVERDSRKEAAAVENLGRSRTARYGRCCLDFYGRAGKAGAPGDTSSGVSGPPPGRG
jgi:16S rRNA (guanine966-N2)-methyltransferase